MCCSVRAVVSKQEQRLPCDFSDVLFYSPCSMLLFTPECIPSVLISPLVRSKAASQSGIESSCACLPRFVLLRSSLAQNFDAQNDRVYRATSLLRMLLSCAVALVLGSAWRRDTDINCPQRIGIDSTSDLRVTRAWRLSALSSLSGEKTSLGKLVVFEWSCLLA